MKNFKIGTVVAVVVCVAVIVFSTDRWLSYMAFAGLLVALLK